MAIRTVPCILDANHPDEYLKGAISFAEG